MNFFDINLYPQGIINKKRNIVIHQMDIVHRMLLLVAIAMTLIYGVMLGRSLLVKNRLDRQYADLKQKAMNQRLTDQEKDNIIFLLNKEKHEIIVGSFLRVLMKHKISGMSLQNIKCKRLSDDLLFTAEFQSAGVSRYRVDDIEKMIDNIIADREYRLKIYNVTIQEMNIEKGGLITVIINGKVRFFE